MKAFYLPEKRERLTEEEEGRLESFSTLLKEHMRDLMLSRQNPFRNLDEVYLQARKEEMDVHLARLHPDKPNQVLYEQIDHVAHVALGVVDLSQGAFDYSSRPLTDCRILA